MKKAIWRILTATILILSLLLTLASCDLFSRDDDDDDDDRDDGENDEWISEPVSGRFYILDGEVTDPDQWFDFDSSFSWFDADGNTGSYDYDGRNIFLYMYVDGFEEEFAYGTLVNGTLKLYIDDTPYIFYNTPIEGAATTAPNEDGDEPKEKLEYSANDSSTCTITGIGNWSSPFLVIPEEIDGYKVTAIAPNAFYGNTNIVSVTLPATLESIGEEAFRYCTKIIEVYDLTSLNLKDHLYSEKFGYITAYITDFYTDKNISSKLFTDNGYIFYVNTDAGLYYLMGYCGNESDLVLPEGINGHSYEIYGFAFGDNSNITSVVIPNTGVSTINENAFSDCDNLITLSIGEGVNHIKHGAFSSCDNIKTIYYNAINVNDISADDRIFAYSGRTTGFEIIVGKNVKRIPAYLCYDEAIYEMPLSSLSFENGSVCESIGKYAFRNCLKMHTLSLAEGLKIIEENAFAGCSALTSIVIPDSVEIIEANAFQGCSAVTSVTIGKGVKTIAEDAFASFYVLETVRFNAIAMDDMPSGKVFGIFTYGGSSSNGIKVIIGSSVTKVPARLFYSMSSAPIITTIEFEANSSCTLLGEDSFSGKSNITSVIFNGTIEEWDAITKGSINFIGNYYEWWNTSSGNYTVTCTNGTIEKDGTVTKK